MPKGGQQRATGRPRSVEEWGETHGARTPRVYPEDRKLNSRPHKAAGSATHQCREATGERPEQNGKTPRTTETTHQRNQKARKADEDPREQPGHQALHGAAPVRARRGQRRPKIGDDEQKKGRGPAPEVNCNPPAGEPRPPFAFQRETYRLELRGSCGQVQAT